MRIMQEASSLSAEEKMRLFDNGQRRENVKACGDQKLMDYRNICLKYSYNNALQAIENELNNRGLLTKSAVNKKLPTFTWNDFHKADLEFVKKYQDNPSIIIDNLNNSNIADNIWVVYLVWAIMLNNTKLVNDLKNTIINNNIYNLADLKTVINNIITDDNLTERIANTINMKTESYNISGAKLKALQSLLNKPENSKVKEALLATKQSSRLREALVKVNQNGKAECDVIVDHNTGWFKTDKAGGIILSGRVSPEGLWKNFADDLNCAKEDLEIKWLGDYVTKTADETYYHVVYTDPKITESLAIKNLDEDIEKHDELNPKLWEDNKLKPEVKEKIELIVNEFLDGLKEDEISIDVKDIIITGSNCSYNYTKDSDLDLHLVAGHIDAPENLYDKIYSAYRSLFNKKLDIEFYGIPVEIYVETEGMPRVSNGCYSVMNDEWLKEPVAEDIPEIDKEAFDKEFKVWEDRYNKIVDNSDEKLDEDLLTDLISYGTTGAAIGNTFGPLGAFIGSLGAVGGKLVFELIQSLIKKEKNKKDEEASTEIINKLDEIKDEIGKDKTEELVDVLDNTVKDSVVAPMKLALTNESLDTLHEDVNTAKSIIADQIRGEWEAISNYDKAIYELEKFDGSFQNAIDILNDIADEEEVHVGEEQKILSELDNNLLDNIEDGRNEAEEKITKE